MQLPIEWEKKLKFYKFKKFQKIKFYFCAYQGAVTGVNHVSVARVAWQWNFYRQSAYWKEGARENIFEKNFEKFPKSIDQTNLTSVVTNNGHPKNNP